MRKTLALFAAVFLLACAPDQSPMQPPAAKPSLPVRPMALTEIAQHTQWYILGIGQEAGPTNSPHRSMQMFLNWDGSVAFPDTVEKWLYRTGIYLRVDGDVAETVELPFVDAMGEQSMRVVDQDSLAADQIDFYRFRAFLVQDEWDGLTFVRRDSVAVAPRLTVDERCIPWNEKIEAWVEREKNRIAIEKIRVPYNSVYYEPIVRWDDATQETVVHLYCREPHNEQAAPKAVAEQ